MSGCPLPPGARLRRAADFTALRHASGRAQNRFFRLRYGVNAQPAARLGMAVSRRVSKRAVERNRIKRQIRESFRHCRASLPRVDVLVIASREAAMQPSPVLREHLDRLWSGLRPLNDDRLPPTIAR